MYVRRATAREQAMQSPVQHFTGEESASENRAVPQIHVHTFVLCTPSLCLCLALSETQNKAFLSWAVLGIGTGRVGQEKTLNKANK